MVAQRYDFGPLFGSTAGFDRVFDLLESATRGEQRDEKYPPYDITGENAYRITLAVAGFKEKRADDYRRAKPAVDRRRASPSRGIRDGSAVPAPRHRSAPIQATLPACGPRQGH